MFRLQLDICKKSIEAILSQVGLNNKKYLITYFSRLLHKHKLKYTITKLEYLALLDGMKHFYPYLWDKQFEVITDYRTLQ